VRFLIRSEGIGHSRSSGVVRTDGGPLLALADTGRRHMLEQRASRLGRLDFSQWDLLAQHMRKSFEYAKQRCTAYPRYVVQRRLMPGVPRDLSARRQCDSGSVTPWRWSSGTIRCPSSISEPVIHATKASDLSRQFDEAVHGGGIRCYRGSVGDGRFLDVQDTSAYIAPACVLQPPASWSLHHAEPFGPLDSVVVVDTQAELLAAMNASNGSLVASIATDDTDTGATVAEELQAFKVASTKPRSRGGPRGGLRGLGAS